MALHTILGANGTIATELVPVLQENQQAIRLVSAPSKTGKKCRNNSSGFTKCRTGNSGCCRL